MGALHAIRRMLCPVLGHKFIGDAHNKLCVYCWKQEKRRYRPGADNAPDEPDILDHDMNGPDRD